MDSLFLHPLDSGPRPINGKTRLRAWRALQALTANCRKINASTDLLQMPQSQRGFGGFGGGHIRILPRVTVETVPEDEINNDFLVTEQVCKPQRDTDVAPRLEMPAQVVEVEAVNAAHAPEADTASNSNETEFDFQGRGRVSVNRVAGTNSSISVVGLLVQGPTQQS